MEIENFHRKFSLLTHLWKIKFSTFNRTWAIWVSFEASLRGEFKSVKILAVGTIWASGALETGHWISVLRIVWDP